MFHQSCRKGMPYGMVTCRDPRTTGKSLLALPICPRKTRRLINWTTFLMALGFVITWLLIRFSINFWRLPLSFLNSTCTKRDIIVHNKMIIVR